MNAGPQCQSLTMRRLLIVAMWLSVPVVFAFDESSTPWELLALSVAYCVLSVPFVPVLLFCIPMGLLVFFGFPVAMATFGGSPIWAKSIALPYWAAVFFLHRAFVKKKYWVAYVVMTALLLVSAKGCSSIMEYEVSTCDPF